MTIAISLIQISCRLKSSRPLSTALADDLPELPDDKKARLVSELGLSVYDASILVTENGDCRLLRGCRQWAAMASFPPTG